MRLPDSSQRLAIVGATGSGKSYSAVWHLSMRDYQTRPWIVYNWKREKLIDNIPGKYDIGLEEIPRTPGIYVAHPRPRDVDEVAAQMHAIWAREGIGIFIDEGYMIPRFNPEFRDILTQGRSKEIPVITLSQRPTWIDQFIFSESEFIQVFRLQKKKDRQNIEDFVPINLTNENKPDYQPRLPEFHSHYYDVGADKLTILRPVPDIEKIYATFDARLRRLKKAV